MATREKKVVGNKHLALKKDLDAKTIKLTAGKQEGTVRKLGRPPKCKDLQSNIVRAKKRIWKHRPKLALALGRPKTIKKSLNQEGEGEEKSASDVLGIDSNNPQFVLSSSQPKCAIGNDSEDLTAIENKQQPPNSSDLAIKKVPVIVKKRFKKRLTTGVDPAPKPKRLRVKVSALDESVLDSFNALPESFSPPKKLGRPSLKVKRGINANKLSSASLEVRNGTRLKVRSSPYTTRSGVPPQLLRNGKRRKFKEPPMDGIDAKTPKTKRRRRLLSTTTDGSNVDSLNDPFVEEQASSRIDSESDSSYLDLSQMENGTWDSDVEVKSSEGIVESSRLYINGEPSKPKENISETLVANHMGKPIESKIDDVTKKTKLSRHGDDENDEVFNEVSTADSSCFDNPQKTDSNSNLCEVSNHIEATAKNETGTNNINLISPKLSKLCSKKLAISHKAEEQLVSSETSSELTTCLSAEGTSKNLDVASLSSDRIERTSSPNSLIADRAITPSENWETMSVTSTPSSKNFDASFDDISEKDTDCENGKEIRRSQRSSIRKSRAALLRVAMSGKRTVKILDKNVDLVDDGVLDIGQEPIFVSPAPDGIGLVTKDIKMEQINASNTEVSPKDNSKESVDLATEGRGSMCNVSLVIESVIEAQGDESRTLIPTKSKQCPKRNLVKRRNIGAIERRRRVKSLNTQDIVHLVQNDMCSMKGRRASDFGVVSQKNTSRKYSSDNSALSKGDKKFNKPKKFKLKRPSEMSALQTDIGLPVAGSSKIENAKTLKDLNKSSGGEQLDLYKPMLIAVKNSSSLPETTEPIEQIPKALDSTTTDEDVMVIEAKLLKKVESEVTSKIETYETKVTEIIGSQKSISTLGVLRDEDMAEKLRELSKKIESESDMFPSLYVKPLIPSLKLEPYENAVKSEMKKHALKSEFRDNDGMPILKMEQKFVFLESESKREDTKLDEIENVLESTEEIVNIDTSGSRPTCSEIAKEKEILEPSEEVSGTAKNSIALESIEKDSSTKEEIVPSVISDTCLNTQKEDNAVMMNAEAHSSTATCLEVDEKIKQSTSEESLASSDERAEGLEVLDKETSIEKVEENVLFNDIEPSGSGPLESLMVPNEKEDLQLGEKDACIEMEQTQLETGKPDLTIQTEDEEESPELSKKDLAYDSEKTPVEEETPENMAVKETILSALGLLSLEAAKAAKIAKVSVPRVGQDNNYTGTLKTIIKVQRSPEKRTRPLKMILKNNKPSSKRDKGFDQSEMNGFQYSICKEAGPSADDPGSSSSAGVGNRKCLKPSFSYRSYFDISSNPQLFVEDTVPAEPEEQDTGGKDGEKKQLVIPEKASSFSIHPGRLCSDVCSYCFGKFGSLDTPCHVAQLKGSERQVKILQAELHLTADSCLCDACYRHVDRKANCPTYREKTKGKKRLHHMSRAARPKATCCVLGCLQTAQHHVRRKWLTKLKRSIGKKVPVINNKLPPHVPLPLCSQHYAWVDHFMICGICRRRLNCNQMYPLGPEVHEINTILAADRIPVSLVEKVFLCKLCRYFTSLRTKFVDKMRLTGSNKMFYESYRKKILHCLDVEITEEPEPEVPKRKRRKMKASSKVEVNGEYPVTLSQDKKQNETVPVINLTSSEESSPPSMDISSMVETQLVEPMIDYSTLGSDAPSVVNMAPLNRPSMPIGNYRVEPVKPTKIRLTFGNTKPGPSTDGKKTNNMVILERDPEVPTFSSVLETPQLSVTANFDFRNPVTVKSDSEGEWEKCAFTLQYDRDSKQAFEKLKRPYGSQSSFFRHLLLLEQYWRSGELVAAPTSNSRTKSYLKSVQNRIDSFSMSAPVPPTSYIPIVPKVQSTPMSSVPIIDLPLRRLSGGIVTTAAPSRPPTFTCTSTGSMPATSVTNPMFVSQVSPTKKYVMNPATGQYVPAKRKPNIVQVTKGGQPLFRLVDPTKSQIRALQGYKRKAPSATVTSGSDCVPLICDVRSLAEEGTKMWGPKPSTSVMTPAMNQPVKQKVAISILPKPSAVGPKPNTVLTPTGIILSKKLDISVSPVVNRDELAKS